MENILYISVVNIENMSNISIIMKKFSIIFCLLIVVVTMPAAARRNSASRYSKTNRTEQSSNSIVNKSEAAFESVQNAYANGRISADSVINLALYHKVWSPELAERCLKLVTDRSPRGKAELGVIYAFSPNFSKHAAEGVKLLQEAANAGYNDANCYLGLYYFNHNDFSKAKSYLEACRPIDLGVGYAALGGMYINGKGMKEDVKKAREAYHQSALLGYPRGMALYGFNLRASAGGPINYPDSFFWLYIAGDLGDDAARTTLYIPRLNENRGNSETALKAQEALQWIEKVQTGKKLKNEPIYKDGFLPSLKSREQAAQQGDDWARFYLGSMNYNGDFLNQNYARAILYYEPIAQNGKLPKNVLATVHERLAKMYREGKGTKASTAKAAEHTRMAAQYGSLPAYKIIENINE